MAFNLHSFIEEKQEEYQKKQEAKAHKKELEKKKQDLFRQKNAQSRLLAEKEYAAELKDVDSKKTIWIDSTQMCLPIKDVIHAMVVTEDTHYVRIIEVQPGNFFSFPVDEQNDYADTFAQMLSAIPGKVQFKCISRRANTHALIRNAQKNFSAESNEFISSMQRDYLNMIASTASATAVSRRFFISIEYKVELGVAVTFDDIEQSMDEVVNAVKAQLSRCGCVVLDTGDTTEGVNSILYDIVNWNASEDTDFEEHAIDIFNAYDNGKPTEDENGNVPDIPLITTDELIAPKWMDFTHRDYCVVDGRYYRIFYIESSDYPTYSFAGWLNEFVSSKFGVGIDVDVMIERKTSETIANKISVNLDNNSIKKTTGTGTDAYATRDRIQSAQYLLDGIAGGSEYFEFYTMITVSADTLKVLNAISSALVKSLKVKSMKLRACNNFMESAFYSTLPICRTERIVRQHGWRNALTDGIAFLYPFLSFEFQEPNGIVMGTNLYNKSLVVLNPFNNRAHNNANMTIIGSSGSGKTFTSQLFAIRQRLQGTQIFIITPMSGKEDYWRICKKIHGQFVSMNSSSNSFINIFDIWKVDKNADLDDGENGSLLRNKITALHTFFKMVYRGMTQSEDTELDRALYDLYESKGITNDDSSIYIPGTDTYKEFPIMEDLYNLLINNPQNYKRLEDFALMIRPYVDGVHQQYNHHTNVDLNNKYIVFDLDRLSDEDLSIALFVCLDFVWSKTKENRLQRKAIYMDEIWKLIGVEGNESAAMYCVEIYKTIRKYGGSAVCMTQNLGDFFKLKNGQYGEAIIFNSAIRIFMKLDEGEVKHIRDVMQLSETEKAELPKLEKGTGIVATGSSHIEVKFTASKEEFNVLTTDPEVLRQEAARKQAREEALRRLQGGTANNK